MAACGRRTGGGHAQRGEKPQLASPAFLSQGQLPGWPWASSFPARGWPGARGRRQGMWGRKSWGGEKTCCEECLFYGCFFAKGSGDEADGVAVYNLPPGESSGRLGPAVTTSGRGNGGRASCSGCRPTQPLFPSVGFGVPSTANGPWLSSGACTRLSRLPL